MHCVGDTVWARLTARGTNLGSVFGKPPTGRSIEITVMEVVRIDEHGQMVEHWGVPDRYALLAQLGLLDDIFAGIKLVPQHTSRGASRVRTGAVTGRQDLGGRHSPRA